MTDLQTAFYIVGIVFMGLMLLLVLVAVTAILVIRSKIVHIQRHIEDRLHTAKELAQKGEAVVSTLKKVSRKRKR